jgi:pyruvate,water dikinase
VGIGDLVRKLFSGNRWRPAVARPDTRAALTLRYLAFKDLITGNDELLEVIADIEQKLEGHTQFSMMYVRFRAVACATRAYRMIMCLDKLSSRRYQELHLVFSSIQRAIEAVLSRTHVAATAGPFTYPLSAVDATLAEKVGGKAANVGEVRNCAHLPVPDAFVISTDAFRAFLSRGQLGEDIRALQISLDPGNLESVNEISQNVQRLITASPVPPPVIDAILAGYDELARRLGGEPRVSMRSSAVGEDGEISFAGLYVTVLNVPREGLIDAYREVIAGLYSPRALVYRSMHGVPDEDVPMAVMCMVLVEAAASGIACSVDPGHPESGTLLITGAWGLGLATVSGAVSPDGWDVSRNDQLILRARPGRKETRVRARPGGGVESVAEPAASASAFCLSDPQVIELARLVLAVEAHYGRPQEVEWALDREGRFFVLQSRRLRLARQVPSLRSERPAPADGYPVLLTGVPASAGCASGPVFHLSESEDAASFPVGAVLVARHSSPQYVKVMGRAAAIVTDIGATTGHMASLAREFGVPAVLDTRTATWTLARNQIVTVDANQGVVYDGRVASLLSAPSAAPQRTMKGTPVYGILRQVADRIVPLNLTDPGSPGFHPGACRTFHDIARFAHEKAFEEMFRMSDRVADLTHKAVRLDEKLPYELYLIDIGGGLRRSEATDHVHAGDIVSEPMRTLLAGMTNPALRWWEPRGISLSGFFAVATELMMNPQYDGGQRRLGDRSYAIVAEAYCNFSSRIGYHFAAVDAYCSDSLTRNYVSFRFKGGAADDVRRARRCELIGEILRRLDFQIERSGDLINARLRKFPKEAILARLDQLGRLVVATRQLDMRMGPGPPVEWFVQAFFAGNYLFEPEARSPAETEEPEP